MCRIPRLSARIGTGRTAEIRTKNLHFRSTDCGSARRAIAPVRRPGPADELTRLGEEHFVAEDVLRRMKATDALAVFEEFDLLRPAIGG